MLSLLLFCILPSLDPILVEALRVTLVDNALSHFYYSFSLLKLWTRCLEGVTKLDLETGILEKVQHMSLKCSFLSFKSTEVASYFEIIRSRSETVSLVSLVNTSFLDGFVSLVSDDSRHMLKKLVILAYGRIIYF